MRNFLKKMLCAAVCCCIPALLAAQWRPAEWPVLKSYDQDHLYHISLPMGGIGTGTVGLGGRGELRDWMIMNRPSVGYAGLPRGANDAPFFAIRIQSPGQAAITKGAMGPIYGAEYDDQDGYPVDNYGVPRFTHASFEAAYPFGQVTLTDEEMPVRVRIKGFNPLIPGDADASGIPVAVLVYEVENLTVQPMEVTVCGNLRNFVGQDGSRRALNWKGGWDPIGAKKNSNIFRQSDGIQGLYMYSDSVDRTDPAWGTMALTTSATEGVSYRLSSVKDSWGRPLLDIWDDLSEDGEVFNRGPLEDNAPWGSLAVKKTVAVGGKETFCFFLTWHFPNRMGWTNLTEPDYDKTIHGNYYTNSYADAWDVAEKTLPRLPALERKTLSFVNAFVGSDLPTEVKEAALFNLSVLRSQTTFRLPDGHLMGWEGIFNEHGSCMGSCTHVWNYEQATAFLFGDLARTMRDVEFNYALNNEGGMSFRVDLPLNTAAKEKPHTAADGQLGTIMKFYRDWQLSGDNEFLRANWPQVKKALAYAWVEWDRDADGVMEGSQHNTMDVNYFGPNPQMSFWYLGALRAGAEMAAFMKDRDFEEKCRDIFARGSAWVDANLFNGEYYEHRITNPDNMFEYLDMDDSAVELPVSQLGRGCLVDQLVGQYMAHICGLGYLAEPEHIRTTLRSVMKYNYLPSFAGHFNNMRSFVLGDEAGLLMGSWPKGRLKVPFPYFAEAMTGFEYTAAVGMIYEGQTENGLTCIRAIRDRFDGLKRNPFEEPECGRFYARSMASWAGVLALTSFHYSGVTGDMTFTARPGTYFWSNGYSWGTCTVTPASAEITVLHGQLTLKSFTPIGGKAVALKNFVLAEGESRTVAFQK